MRNGAGRERGSRGYAGWRRVQWRNRDPVNPLPTASGDTQSVRCKRSKIRHIACGQPCLLPDGNGRNAAVRIALGPTTCKIEQLRRLLCIHTHQWFCDGKKLTCKSICRGRQRAAQELTPCHRTDAKSLTSRQPSDQSSLLLAAQHKRINQEIRVEMNHN